MFRALSGGRPPTATTGEETRWATAAELAGGKPPTKKCRRDVLENFADGILPLVPAELFEDINEQVSPDAAEILLARLWAAAGGERTTELIKEAVLAIHSRRVSVSPSVARVPKEPSEEKEERPKRVAKTAATELFREIERQGGTRAPLPGKGRRGPRNRERS